MKRFFYMLGALLIGLISAGNAIHSTAAQMSGAEPAFSNTRIGDLGLPTLIADGSADGFTFSVTEVSAGPLHVVLNSTPDVAVYLDFMQIPAGTDHETAVQQALLMGREDIPADGWVYGGGSYIFSGGSVEFIVDLTAGDWQLAASYQPDGADEIMTLTPFTVHDATPTAAVVDTDVTLELQDVAFSISSETVNAGPQLWNVTNTGERPRQMVLVKTPHLFSTDEFIALFANMMQGTPSPVMTQMIWVGYAAVASPGYGTVLELDLEPGTYTAASFVVDAETQMPALMLGMVQSFTVA